MVLADINRHDSSNVGRLLVVYFLLENHIFSFPYTPDVLRSNVQLDGNIYMKTNTAPYSLYFTPRTEQYTERSSNTRQGKLYDVELQLSVPKDRQEVATVLQQIGKNKVTVFYNDKNNLVKVIRNARLTSTTTLDGGNEYQLTFVTQAKERQKFWNIQNIIDGIEYDPNVNVQQPPDPNLPTTNGITLIDGSQKTLRLSYGSGQTFDFLIVEHHTGNYTLEVKTV